MNGPVDPLSILHGASEMIMDGFMHLRCTGILTRKVYDDIEMQRALDAGIAVTPERLTGWNYLKYASFLGSKAFYVWLREPEGDDYPVLQ